MAISRKVLCWGYAAIAVVALVGFWGNVLKYPDLGYVSLYEHWLLDTLASPASRSTTVGLFFLSLAVVVWLLLEARRLEMRGRWWYVLGGVLVAMSAAIPLFLLHRELTLAARGEEAGTLRAGDVVGVLVLAVGFVGYAIYTLRVPG